MWLAGAAVWPGVEEGEEVVVFFSSHVRGGGGWGRSAVAPGEEDAVREVEVEGAEEVGLGEVGDGGEDEVVGDDGVFV